MKKRVFLGLVLVFFFVNNVHGLTETNPQEHRGVPGVLMLLLDDEVKDIDPHPPVHTWEVMSRPMLEKRYNHAVVSDSDGNLYVIGGIDDPVFGWGGTNTIFLYNTATGKWDRGKALTDNLAKINLAGIDAKLINGKIYVPGDLNNNKTYVYNIVDDEWSNFEHNNGFSARAYYSTVVIESNLYVLGGVIEDLISTNQVWVLNTETGEWTEGTPMQDARMNFAAAVIHGDIYVAGGAIYPGFDPVMSVEKNTSDQWSYIGEIPDGDGSYDRWSFMAHSATESTLWLAGGLRSDDPEDVLNHAGYYDPLSNIWEDSFNSIVPTLTHGRTHLSGAVASDGYFYVIGGLDEEGKITDINERIRVVD